MELVKLSTKQLGLDGEVEVKGTIRTQLKIESLVLASMEVDDDPIKELKKEHQFTLDVIDFIKELLNLTNKQVDKLMDSINVLTLGEYLGYMSARLKGVPEEAFDEELEKVKKTHNDQQPATESEESGK